VQNQFEGDIGLERQRIQHILKNGQPEHTASISGWIRSKRDSKTFAFLVLNDGSSQDNLQVVVDPNTSGYDQLARCQTGASVKVIGTLKTSQGKGQSLELLATNLEVIGEAPVDSYPLQKKGHTLEFLRDIAHLRGRTNTFGAVFRVRNALAHGVHEFFQSRGFMWVHTPIITASDCEGAGEMFKVTTLDFDKTPRTPDGKVDFAKDFFGKPAHLTVSGQLEGEFLALSLGDIYTFGPTFRAENSNTTRHLAEFWMIEPEMAFADLNDDMQLAEDFLRFLCGWVVKKCPTEMAFLEQMYKGSSVAEIARLAETPFTRMTYTEAVDELSKAKAKFEFPVSWGVDLQSEHERFLTDQVVKGPVIVTNYPKDIKSFYMKLNDDGKTVAAMDVLAPRIGEIIGGSQREDRLDALEARMAAMKIPAAELQWYLDLRRFGSCPHAGFGLGFERIVQYLTGMTNIRDTIPCPRAPGLIEF
jgi:asparaginyl-tRNA synthetase